MRLAIAMVVLAIMLVAGANAASAQAAPEVQDRGVTNNFPDGMVFAMSASSDTEITGIRFRYEILPDGTRANGVPDFAPGTTVTTTFEIGGETNPVYFPPGTTVVYHWEVTDADGDVGKSPEATFVYLDDDFDWRSVSGNGVTIYFYSGDPEDSGEMLDVAADSLAEMSELLGTTVDFPVNVWVYETTADMRPSLQRRSASYEEDIITAGVRVASDTVLVLGNVAFDTLRHELTHVVTKQAGESALGTLPAWLDEGTAVYGQNDPGGFRNAIEQAIARGNVLSVRSITSYPGDPAKVTLFYGQGWSLVTYLIDTYGREQFAALFAEVKSGNRIDDALEAVYGFDQDGLEDEWRAANDLPPRETPEPQDAQPTTDGEDAPSEGSSDDGSGSSSTIVILVMVLALAAIVGVGGLLIARRLK